MPETLFTPETLKFLRGLARHNDRNWFEARRETYELAVKEPLLRLVDGINAELVSFAPSHVRPPAKTAMRIYRDTRFSPDKRPYKRHLGAWWAERQTERTTGAGFYFHLSATEIVFAAGIFNPSAPQLLGVRRWLAEHHELYGKLVQKVLASKAEPAFLAAEPQALKRVPRGFAADHPAAEWLRATRWGVHLQLPAEAALEPGFPKQLAGLFRRSSPVVLALAGALREAATERPELKDPLF